MLKTEVGNILGTVSGYKNKVFLADTRQNEDQILLAMYFLILAFLTFS